MKMPALTPRLNAKLADVEDHIYESTKDLSGAALVTFDRLLCCRLQAITWRLTAEGPPKPNSPVIVYTGLPNNPVCQATLYLSREEEIWLNELGQAIRTPSHWRPLPAAPKTD